MKLTEKMSYLQGLLDGLEVDTSTKEGKALVQMSDVMQEMVMYVEDLQAQVDELTELCDILDADLGDVEEEVFDLDDDCCCEDDDCDCDFDDEDEMYEVCCPSSGDTILLNDSILEEGSIECPNCGYKLKEDKKQEE